MHDAFRDALVIEVRDFFTQNEVLQQRGAAFASLQRVLVVCNDEALICS